MNELKPAVLFLGTALVVAVLGIVVLAALKVPIPAVLASLAFADLTGLAALLRPVGASTPPPAHRGPQGGSTRP